MVEVGVGETDGTLTRFAEGETILTVKFRRRNEDDIKHNAVHIY